MSSDGKKPPDLSRRGFLALSAAGAAGVAASGCGPSRVSDFLELTEAGPRPPGGEERWVTSVCGQCHGGCSIRVRTIGGRAVNITGNPFYPLNRKGLCPAGLAGLQVLYSPDRVRRPLRRAGDRGAGQWVEIGWDEAIQTVAETLGELRQRGEPHTLAFLSGESRGLMDTLISRFCRAYGTPNDVRKLSPGLEAEALAHYCMQGNRAPLTYDLDNTNCILSFGSPLLEASLSPVRMLRAYGHLRQKRPGPKAKIIQIDPRLSVTAAKADEWVPINPGTEGALALGIAYTLIREGLYDKDFVENHTFGFEDWKDDDGRDHIGFKQLVLHEYHVDEVARITGVPVNRILRITKEFAAHRPAVALGELTCTNAVYGMMAIHALNALVGSIDARGGVVFPHEVPLKKIADVEVDATAREGTDRLRLDAAPPQHFPLARHSASSLARAALEEKPYKVNALFLYYANPAFSSPEPDRFAQAFTKIPFIVSFSPFLDESSMYADLVLPDHTYLERWQDDPAPPVVPYSLFGLRQPVVSPLYDTMHTGDVLIALAKKLGGSVGAGFPWSDFPDMLRRAVDGLYEVKRGGIVEQFQDKSWTELLEERGWWLPSAQTSDEFWAELRDKGGWWDPIYYFGEWHRVLRTPSEKFEFYSLTLKETFDRLTEGSGEQEMRLLSALRLAARGDRLCLPHFEPPRFAGSLEQYPFVLNVMRLLPLAAGRQANQPFLQEILGPHVRVPWDSWAEINPESAEPLGIHDGDPVWVESPVGKVKTRAKFNPGSMPGVVSIPANLGHTAYGRWARNIGVNPMRITADEYDHLAGLSAVGATRVKIYKA